ncbi:MAG: TIGR03960 family B12-binding radical SAM protein [Acidobacteria bacterium]|nr:TIGR03960 family B12-binding radical SAM protein [Acidobacteriota bacterium]
MNYPPDLLRKVNRPGRYTGGEYNIVRKAGPGVASRVALVFPEVYEIGMSHLGTHLLYDLLNADPAVAAERFHCPWPDMEEQLRRRRHPILSLETGRPLADFDVVGVSVLYELTATNLLTVLDLAGIPFRSADRDGRHPLVVAGGPGVSNPEPLADFFDAVVIGDGEEALPEIIRLEREARAGRKRDRPGLLQRLAGVPGVYVPSLYPLAERDGRVTVDREAAAALGLPLPIRKRVVRDLAAFPLPAKPLVPSFEIVHDRITAEISRGCNQGCRFCHASFYYRPQRERPASQLLRWLLDAPEGTGWDEVSLSSLSSGGYTGIEDLAQILAPQLKRRQVSLSFPSLRAGSLSRRLAEAVSDYRKTGFTLAPEAGSQRLRDAVNKNLTEDQILEAVFTARRHGWDLVKLYFMIGLPGETDEDLEAVAALVRKIQDGARAVSGPGVSRRPLSLNVSVSPFVPKPHTPFQWAAMDPPAELARKVSLLRGRLRDRAVKLKWHDPVVSRLEGVLSRGDRRVSAVVAEAWRRGARFDGWNEVFRPEAWEAAFEAVGVGPRTWLDALDPDTPTPWSHVDLGARTDWLRTEWDAALTSRLTPACVSESAGPAPGEGLRFRCRDCGAACTPADLARRSAENARFLAEALGPAPPGENRPADPAPGPSEAKPFRLTFSRSGPAVWLSHLDQVRVLQRTLRRSGMPIRYSEGFHPHPVLGFSPALGVGVAAASDYLDGWALEKAPERDAWLRRLNAVSVEGITFHALEWLPDGAPSIEGWVNRADYRVSFPADAVPGPDGERTRQLEARIRDLLASPRIEVERTRKGETARKDIRPFILDARLSLPAGGGAPGVGALAVDLCAALTNAGTIRPEEWVSLVLPGYDGPWEATRTRLYRA